MSSMETIVRPFETTDIAPSTPFFTPGKAGVPNVVLQVGRGGGGKMFSGDYHATASYYMTEYDNEQTSATWGTQSQ